MKLSQKVSPDGCRLFLLNILKFSTSILRAGQYFSVQEREVCTIVREVENCPIQFTHQER